MDPIDKTEGTLRDESESLGGDSGRCPGLWIVSSTVPELQGATLPIRGATVIGRGMVLSGNRALSDARVSRQHVEVSLKSEDLAWVKDLDSHNGTLVHGKRIGSRAVGPRQPIQVGGTFFQFLPDLRPVMEVEPDDAIGRHFLGTSPAARAIRTRIRNLAQLDVSVMILGPPGAGKEQVAGALHLGSLRTGPLVTLNCAILTNDLAASALFGHTRGAYTGATTSRAGAFRNADGGTLFLDEVCEMPLDVQPKLLRALQDSQIQSLGSDNAQNVDVRVVAASNQDVSAMVKRKALRGDLYSRLSGGVIVVPPLAERPADIVELTQHFLGPDRQLHPSTVAGLLNHSWPHNVRNLMAVVALLGDQPSPVRMTLPARDKLAADRQLTLRRIPTSSIAADLSQVHWPKDAPERKRVLQQLLERCDGNIQQVAVLLGKRPTSIRRWLKMYGIDLGHYRGPE